MKTRSPKRRVSLSCSTPSAAHALRHELDKAGALSRRRGHIATTTATKRQILAARKRARRSVHHGRSR